MTQWRQMRAHTQHESCVDVHHNSIRHRLLSTTQMQLNKYTHHAPHTAPLSNPLLQSATPAQHPLPKSSYRSSLSQFRQPTSQSCRCQISNLSYYAGRGQQSEIWSNAAKCIKHKKRNLLKQNIQDGIAG
jgi:hypothetical protein